MNEKKNVASQAEHAGGCDRAEELIAYLYGEAQPAKARAFRAHLEACDACREELSDLGAVRGSVALLREEAHGLAPSLDLGGLLDTAAVRSTPAPTRSALAALREFFSLSPLWLQAGVATAALVLCGLAALTLARAEMRWDDEGFAFRTVGDKSATPARPAPASSASSATSAPAPAGYTREQVDQLVAERVAGEVAAARARWEAENRQTTAIVAASEVRQRAPRTPDASAKGTAARRRPPATQPARRPEVALEDEENLPRLSDLLSGGR
jgi:anti-sigma factor RsiW